MVDGAAAAAPAPEKSGSGAVSHGYEFDLFVIGGGSGGVRAARTAAGFGAKVAICELPFNPISSDSAGGMGGTCVLRGCVPKKILVYGSEFSHGFRDAKGFGWELKPDALEFNWKTLQERKTHEITRLNGVYKKLLLGVKVAIFEGRGNLVNRHTVVVKAPDGAAKTFTAKHILIATGARAVRLGIPGSELGITSDEALSLESFPHRVVIVGAGYIAVEFAGIFSGMGAEVHLFYRKALPLTGFDEEMRGVVARNLEGRGIRLHPEANLVKLEQHYLGIRALSDKNEEFFADAVLFATGRKPNSKGLDLEAAGVRLDDAGAVVVNEYSQSSVPNIWAVGDVTNRLNLTPVALMEGTAFAKTVFNEQPTPPDYANVASAVFCQPPLAVVGFSEEKATAREDGGDVSVFTSSFNPMKNTISGRQEKTFIKLIVDDASDKVIGAAMCGPDAPEIMQSVAVALKCGATKAQFDSTVGIHPTAAEELVTMRTVTRRLAPNGVLISGQK